MATIPQEAMQEAQIQKGRVHDASLLLVLSPPGSVSLSMLLCVTRWRDTQVAQLQSQISHLNQHLCSPSEPSCKTRTVPFSGFALPPLG